MFDSRKPIIFILLTFYFLTLHSEIFIKDIIFEGNELVSDILLAKRINSKIGEKFDQATVNEDVKRLQDIYLEKNIFNFNIIFPEIITQQNEEVIIVFHIEEFNEFIIDSLAISGNNYIGLEKINNYILEKNIILADLPDIMADIVEFYNSRSFFFTEVRIDSLKYSDSKYVAYLKIQEGKYSKVKEFLFRGNKTSTEIHSCLR